MVKRKEVLGTRDKDTKERCLEVLKKKRERLKDLYIVKRRK